MAAVIYKGGACADCHRRVEVEDINAYDFHHRVPEDKLFNFGGAANRSSQSIRHELDKCDLVCAFCHRKRHGKQDQAIVDYALGHPLDFSALTFDTLSE